MSDVLRSLFISKVRLKLLEIFLQDPHELFYVRQLVRLTSEEINAVRRELLNLESIDFLHKEQRSNRLYYSANTKNIFFEDLLAMFLKTTGLGSQFIKNRAKIGKIKAVFFSNRFAYHQPRLSEDDLEIVIIADAVLPEVSALIQAEEVRRGNEINYTVLDIEEYNFRKLKRDPFINTILTIPKIMIVGTQSDLS